MELIIAEHLLLSGYKQLTMREKKILYIYISFQHFVFFPNGENGRFRTNIQKTLEIEQVSVPSQYLVGAGNHICRTPNALKTS